LLSFGKASAFSTDFFAECQCWENGSINIPCAMDGRGVVSEAILIWLCLRIVTFLVSLMVLEKFWPVMTLEACELERVYV
jgi:hypothetical protein